MRRPVCSQSGVALLVGLVFMAAIGLLALVGAASMVLQVRMAGNFADDQRAHQGGTQAVLQGAQLVFSLGHDVRSSGCNSGCFQSPEASVIRLPAQLPALPEQMDASWWQAQGSEISIDPLTGAATGDDWTFSRDVPRYLIEEIHFEPAGAELPSPSAPKLEGVGYYRVIGRGNGLGPAAVSVSAAIIARPWLSVTAASTGPTQTSDFCADFKPWYDCGPLSWHQRR